MEDQEKRVSRRAVFIGALVGIPSAALIALVASQQVRAEGRDPQDDDDDDDD
ncbi:MAG: hypothetical protein K8F31_05355 [Roseovarius sp.]|nr:hypothetical protein [Roseovarius sp.]